MKNIVIVEIDTDKENPVIIKKSTEFVVPDNTEDLAKVIKNDIITLCGGITTLIEYSDKNNLGSKEDYIEATIKTLNELLKNSSENQVNIETE